MEALSDSKDSEGFRRDPNFHSDPTNKTDCTTTHDCEEGQ